MIISTKNQFIFIHVFKTGGTSVQSVLKAINAGQVNMFGDLEVHYHSRAYQIAEIMGRELFNRYFSFGFARNPWDFEYSLYKFKCRVEDHWGHEEAISFKDYKHYLKFNYYKYLESKESGSEEELDTQMSFLCDHDSKQLVTFIGKFESLAQDFYFIMNKIGIEAPGNALPHVNKSTRGDFRSHYDPAMVDWIAEMHARDIAFFNYSFE